MSYGKIAGAIEAAYEHAKKQTGTKEEVFEKIVQFLMKKGWSKTGARYRADQMLGGGLLRKKA